MKIAVNIDTNLYESYLNGSSTIICTRNFPKAEGSICYLYASYPTSKVVGEAVVESVLKVNSMSFCYQSILKILTAENDFNILKDFIGEHGEGYLIKIKNVIKYSEPLRLRTIDLYTAPIDWCYVSKV